MPPLPKPNEKSFELTPQGNHIAVCYRVIDLGTQAGEWMGKPNRKHKILISWEIPDELMDDGKPFTISQRFTWSMAENASLRQVLESWRGRAFVETDFGANGFDIKNLLGVPCMLNVVHESKNGKTYDNIKSIAKLPKGTTTKAAVNDPCFVWLSREEFSQVAFEKLSDGLKAVLQATPEYKMMSEPGSIRDADQGTPRTLEDMDEIPF